MEDRSRSRELLKIVLAAGGSVVLSLLAAEGALRIFLPQQESMKWFRSDRRYGYVLKKNFHQQFRFAESNFTMDVVTNEWGHRHAPYDKKALSDPRVRKILLIGDSFTFGHGVNMEDYFGTLLEEQLNHGQHRYMVMNAGVGGWGTLQAAAYVRDHLRIFHPSFLVYTFCGKDPGDDARFEAGEADNERGRFQFPGKIFLRDYSHLYRFLSNRLSILSNRLTMGRKLVATVGSSTQDVQSGSVISEEEWRSSLNAIEGLYGDLLRENPKGVLLLQASAPWDMEIRKHLASLEKDNSLIYVDLLVDSQKLSDEERRLPYDGHWGRRMHALVAQRLGDVIRDRDKVAVIP